MTKVSFRKRWHYWMDNMFAKGPVALITGLAIISALMVLVAALVLIITNANQDAEGKLSFFKLLWMSMLRTLDPGTMSGDDGGPLFLGMMLTVTIGGIFVVSTLIGILNSGIEQKLDELRKGRSFVVENGHTIILGWSAHVASIISELVIANENQPYSCVVVMADHDKVEMEDELRSKLGRTGKTRIVCRTGNPMRLDDLAIVNPNDAKAIVVLSPEGEDPDIQVIKTILAITNNPSRKSDPYHIVAEIRASKNLEVARMIGKDEVELLLAKDIISRIAVQTCCQSGLSVIYNELLDFGGDEIYFHAEPGLTGKSFSEALLMYESSAIMGLRFRDGRIQLKPELDTVIQDGDKVIAISEDDDTIRLSGLADPKINEAAIQPPRQETLKPERTLILGWNQWAITIVNELDNYMAPGSGVTIIANLPEVAEEIAANRTKWRNQQVSFTQGDITDRPTLDSLNVEQYQHVIVLSYSGQYEAELADAETLVTLLHLREIAAEKGENFSITSEMLDVRNRELAEIAQVDDFIVSDRLISLMMTQIAENKELMPVFTDLFDADGSELYLKPAANYVKPGEVVNFYTVMEAARRRNEIAIGYRLAHLENVAAEAYGVRVNPVKSEMITFSSKDKVIVLAED